MGTTQVAPASGSPGMAGPLYVTGGPGEPQFAIENGTFIVVNHVFSCDLLVMNDDFLLDMIYPLVICYIAIEHGHRNSGFSH